MTILPTPSVGDPERVEFQVEGQDGPIFLRGHRWRSSTAGDLRPALVEFNPYRCRDGTLYSDSLMYPYFAEQGYDCYRIDLPGSGDSTGVLRDEYTAQELSCCRQAIMLIAAETGANGRVCMMGKSWSAINALMVAAFDPPEALAAVIFCCGTDDRFEDDVHYMGGAMMADNFSWASSMFGWNFLPPDPEATPDWQAQWLKRVEQADFWLRIWGAPENQERSDYWSATSVRDHYGQVRVPVFLLSGWRDGYKNPVLRAFSGLVNSPDVRAVIGPWGHKYPFNGHPGPQIDWLRPVERWLHAWLKEPDSAPPALEGWPRLLAWIEDSSPPSRVPAAEMAGRWVAEDAAWAKRSRTLSFYPLPSGELASQPADGEVIVDTPRDAGAQAMTESSSWGEAGNADLPGDMGPDDEVSVIFQTAPLAEDIDLFGFPSLTLDFSAEAERGALCLRLSEIDPESGGVHLISYRFASFERLSRPVELNALGHRLKAGWRLRLSVSTHWMPTLWPTTPVNSPVTLHLGAGTRLDLPVRLPRREDEEARPLAGVFTADADRYCPSETLYPGSATRGVWRGVQDGHWVTELRKSYDSGKVRYGELTIDQAAGELYRADPASETYSAESWSATEQSRGSWWARTETETCVEWSGGETYRYRCHVTISDSTGLLLTKPIEGILGRRRV